MLKAIYPGSFDPVTRGHYDIICRSCKIVDKLIVGVLNNKAKMPLFSVEERVKMLKEVTKDLPNVEIIPFDGLAGRLCGTDRCRCGYQGITCDYRF